MIFSPSFYKKLIKISNKVGLKPEDILLIMAHESGLKPSAGHSAGASGLVQVMPETLKNTGFKGDVKQFRSLDVENQLDYIGNLISGQVNYAKKVLGRNPDSAVEYFLCNFWGAALQLPEVKNKDPNAVIVYSEPTQQRYKGISLNQEKAAYNQNKGLDVDKDGKITYGDLLSRLQSTKSSKIYQEALSELKSVDSSVEEPKIQKQDISEPKEQQKSPMSNIDPVKMLEELEKLTFASKPKNFVIKIASSSIRDSIEFARILLNSIDDNFNVYSSIHTDFVNSVELEVYTKTLDSPQLTKLAILDMSDEAKECFSELYNKVEIIKTNKSISSYPEIDTRDLLSNNRRFVVNALAKNNGIIK